MMDALDMISGPLLFSEHLREHFQKVHQAVELTRALVDAQLAAENGKARHLHEQISEIKGEADRIKHSLYDQFSEMHFRKKGGYALGQCIDSLDKMAESAEEFGVAIVLCGTPVPTELHADFRALVSHVAQVSEEMLNLAGTLWPPEETVLARQEAADALEAIERIDEVCRQAKRLGMEFARHIYSLGGRIEPASLLCLDRCNMALRETVKCAERAADYLRLVIR
jgi:uncharacterized protein Yka (UPF0111/DUF47 family)